MLSGLLRFLQMLLGKSAPEISQSVAPPAGAVTQSGVGTGPVVAVPPTDSPNSLQLDALVTKHEGIRLNVYNDQYGNPTIGIGHNLKAKPLPAGWTAPITVEQAQTLLQADVCNVG